MPTWSEIEKKKKKPFTKSRYRPGMKLNSEDTTPLPSNDKVFNKGLEDPSKGSERIEGEGKGKNKLGQSGDQGPEANGTGLSKEDALRREPSSQLTSEPSAQLTSEPSTQFSSEPSSQFLSEPLTQPTNELSSQPSSQPTNEPPAQPANELSSQPSSELLSQLSKEPSSQLSSELPTQPANEPSSQPTNETLSKSESTHRGPTKGFTPEFRSNKFLSLITIHFLSDFSILDFEVTSSSTKDPSYKVFTRHFLKTCEEVIINGELYYGLLLNKIELEGIGIKRSSQSNLCSVMKKKGIFSICPLNRKRCFLMKPSTLAELKSIQF